MNLFFEDSTRTRISFEAAAKRLSADVINFSAKGSSLSKGESLKDTALTLEAMGADAMVIRHGSGGAPHRLANPAGPSPASSTPATAPTSTRRRRCSTLSLCGGTSPQEKGRVSTAAGSRSSATCCTAGARSNALAQDARRRGHPGGASHAAAVGIEGWGVETSYDLDAVIPKADAVMTLRVQRERMNAAFFPTVREYSRRYGLDSRRMATLQDHAIVMHPGPMVRGMEITADVADSDPIGDRRAGDQRCRGPDGRPLPAPWWHESENHE